MIGLLLTSSGEVLKTLGIIFGGIAGFFVFAYLLYFLTKDKKRPLPFNQQVDCRFINNIPSKKLKLKKPHKDLSRPGIMLYNIIKYLCSIRGAKIAKIKFYHYPDVDSGDKARIKQIESSYIGKIGISYNWRKEDAIYGSILWGFILQVYKEKLTFITFKDLREEMEPLYTLQRELGERKKCITANQYVHALRVLKYRLPFSDSDEVWKKNRIELIEEIKRNVSDV